MSSLFVGWLRYWQYISILNKFDAFKVDNNISYSILMFNKVALGYLYYQLITAVRKDTKK